MLPITDHPAASVAQKPTGTNACASISETKPPVCSPAKIYHRGMV